jgi:predicted DNA repair protein MutK
MRGTGARNTLGRGLRIGAVALCALIAVFIAAPSTWGNGIVDHGGHVVQDTSHSIAAPRTLPPAQGHHLQAAAHTLVMVVLAVVLGVVLLAAARRLHRVNPPHVVSPASVWADRRGPPVMG